MPRSRAFHAAGWEFLEGRCLPSLAAVSSGPSPVVPVHRTGAYALGRISINLRQAAKGTAEIVVLGDSIADFWTTRGAASWAAVMAPRGAVNFGIFGNTTGELLAQVAAGELKGKPKVVVLMIGANNIVLGNTPAQVAQGIAANVAAIRAASPRSHVLLMGLLPMGGVHDSALNLKASLVNTAIARLDDGARVHFRNIVSAFVLPGGAHNRALIADDIHLTASGYSVWAAQISRTLDVLTGRGLRQASL